MSGLSIEGVSAPPEKDPGAQAVIATLKTYIPVNTQGHSEERLLGGQMPRYQIDIHQVVSVTVGFLLFLNRDSTLLRQYAFCPAENRCRG